MFTFGTENSVLSPNTVQLSGRRESISTFTASTSRPRFLYEVPWFKEQRGFVGHLLGGFQINANWVYNSGRPYSPSQSFNSSFLAPGTGSYQTTTGLDPLRPFLGNPNAPVDTVAINQVEAARIYGTL